MQPPSEQIPLRWFTKDPNFGDYLSPWLVHKITGKQVATGQRDATHYLVIGSIIKTAQPNSIVWGSGAFGTETKSELCRDATYLAVRGPLTRNKLELHGIKCPRVYGDPALLVPDFYKPKREPTHEVGVIIRWSELDWQQKFEIDGVRKIYFGTTDIETTLDAMLDCKRIVSSSLHGLILADAYGIPNAWLSSRSPKGREFKFWDYFCSVKKPRDPMVYDLLQPGLTVQKLIHDLAYDGSPITIDLDPLRSACPFGYESFPARSGRRRELLVQVLNYP
jgi:pyruvyltransferase